MTDNVLGVFQYEDEFLSAARQLRESGYDNLTLMTPIPVHAAEKIQGLGKSNVRRFTLFGAIFGAATGFGLAVITALVFILPTGGRAIIAIPPYLIITYEMTILFGILFTLLGFHFVSGLPAWHDKIYRTESGVDRFTLVVTLGEGPDADRAESIIRNSGAEEVSRPEGDT
jgi:hypothetical protein